jgi:hypothetical protein
MNSQAAHIRIVDNKANVAEVIRCEQLTKRYPRGNVLAVDRLDFEVHSYE